jgi:regulator of protease activity HflC (stomatin/prohibitin superfamily)
VGTVKETGFFYGSPLYWRTRVSLRVRTFETGVTKSADVKDSQGKVLVPGSEHRKPSKVNDRDGTPIEIAAVVVWKVINPTEAVFQVDDYVDFVRVQSEAALRNLASKYPYDGRGEERSLRGNTAEIGEELKRELHERLHVAGVEVPEARISYLAYATEIAAAMLQRQQAGAIIAARQLIVEAAVGMVEHALEELARRQVVELDSERKAAMVSNLMVVLCGHSNPQPVLNTGTLYN